MKIKSKIIKANQYINVLLSILKYFKNELYLNYINF